MQPTSIDVLSSALGPGIGSQLGELSSPDGAVTLLFCEIANIAVIRRDSTPTGIATLLADQREMIQRIARLHGAEIAQAHEDGYLIVSDSAHAALSCAIDLQRSVASATGDSASTVPQLRIGLHTGPVIAGTDDLYGRNVLLGARIASKAEGGEIVVSAKVREYTQSDPRFHFVARGAEHFTGLHGEHDLFAVIWTGPEQS
jgi:adenylate cyclase